MSFLSRAFTGVAPEVRAVTSSHFAPPSPDQVSGTGGMGLRGVGPGEAMSLTAFNACVCLLADTISALTVTAYRKQGNTRIALDPQPTLFNGSPYPELDWFEWLWMEMECLAVTGNSFCYVTSRGPDERPTGLMPLHPDVLQIEIPKRQRWPEPVFRIEGSKVPADDIAHFRRYPVVGAVMGMSPVQKAAAAVGLALAAERYGLRYFIDSANPSSVLETDADLDPNGARETLRRWVSTQGGRRLPAVLSGGLKWKPISIAPNEAQFLETRQFQRSEIAMMFRIPPHMIGDTQKSTTWGSGIESMSIGFVKFTLMPWLTCIEQKLSRMLPRGQFVKFNIDGLLRGDVKSRWEAYQLGRNTGVYSPNEIRAMEDLPPVEDGDGRIQPVNFAPLGWTPPAGAQDAAPDPEEPTKPASKDDPADSEDDEEDDDDEK